MSARLVVASVCAVLLFASAPADMAFAGSDTEPDDGTEAPVESTPTPLLVGSAAPPAPVRGSDGRTHLVWEVPLLNASGRDLTVTEIVVEGDGEEVAAFDEQAVEGVVEQLGTNEPDSVVESGRTAYAYLTASFDSPDSVPATLIHSVTVSAEHIPEPLTLTGGETVVARDAVVPVLGPPMAAGDGFLVAGGCCEPQWHIRSPIPVDNDIWFAQRFAVDWVQVDAEGRMRDGPKSDPESYTIYGHSVVAVAAGTVVSAVDGLADQTAGEFPENISLAEADGNSVILDIGNGLFVLYAHLVPGSVAVKVGDRVEAGQTLGKVGNSGNSIVPHLHFQVMDRAASLAASGRPYAIAAFDVTAALDPAVDFLDVETSRKPVAIVASDQDGPRTDALPVDGSIVTFPAAPGG